MLSKEFVLAGRAVFTVEIPESFEQQFHTKPWYTYKVTKMKGNLKYPPCYLIAMLTGPDNISNFTYLGKLEEGKVVLTQKSSFNDNSWPVRILKRSLVCIWNNSQDVMVNAGFNIHHEGRCGKPLTVPKSCETGLGPICREVA